MADIDLSAALAGFRRSAWRLEARDVYDSEPEHRSIAEWRAGRPVPPRTDGWLEFVISNVRAGRSIGRVHAVSRPLSEYVRYEFALYAQHAVAGEDVRIADRSLHRDGLAVLRDDFWIFDDEVVALMRYDEAGRFVGATDASDRVDTFRHVQRTAVSAAVSFNAWTRTAAVVGE